MPALNSDYQINRTNTAAVEDVVESDFSDLIIDESLETESQDLIPLAEQSIIGSESPIASLISRPVFSYDIPEVSNVTANFVYNYFTKDERVQPEGDVLLDLQHIEDSNLVYQAQTENLPRYVKIDFSPSLDPYASLVNTSEINLIENLSKIIVEGASSSKYFTGFELIDSGLEPAIYSMLSGSLTLLNIATPEDSPLSSAEKLSEILSEGTGLTGENKKILIDVMSNLQNEGLKFAPGDVPLEVAEFAKDQITSQNFGVKLNNLFISDLINRSNRFSDSVFQDELSSITGFCQNIQQNLLSQINPAIISEIEFQNVINSIEERDLSDDLLSDINIYNQGPKFYQVGYLLYKYEVLPDSTKKLVDIVPIENLNAFRLIDSKIRYGATYYYKIRSIVKIEVPIRTFDDINNADESMKLVTFLAASEGRDAAVQCVERIPPPPPESLRIRLDYRSKLPYITWQFPFNKQRDIKRFQIFKRSSINEAFVLLAEYDFDDSVIRTSVGEIAQSSKLYKMKFPKLNFLDTSFVPGSNPIYALGCVDAHGFSSNLSAQIQITYDKFRNKIISKPISKPGAPKPFPNLYLKGDAFLDCGKVSGFDRMHVFFDPEYYRVLKNRTQTNGQVIDEADQNLLAVNPNFETYRINILNVDNQKSLDVKIKLAEVTGVPLSQNPASVSEGNLSFEFGIDQFL